MTNAPQSTPTSAIELAYGDLEKLFGKNAALKLLKGLEELTECRDPNVIPINRNARLQTALVALNAKAESIKQAATRMAALRQPAQE